MSNRARRSLAGRFSTFLAGLRSPQLFLVAITLFGLDLVVPDLVPYLDEAFLGIVSLLLARWKTRKEDPASKPPPKNVTPAGD